MPSSKQAPQEVGIIRGTEWRDAVSVPAQHQVSTRHKLKPRTKEFNITTHEPENLESHLNTLTFEPPPFYIYS
jgi:hypothetical protein